MLAQWQGLTHSIYHAPELHQADAPQLEKNDAHHASSHHENSKHHCAAYDSLTLNFALAFHPPTLKVVDAKHEVIKQYQTYQASIEAGAPFEARAPPAKHV